MGRSVTDRASVESLWTALSANSRERLLGQSRHRVFRAGASLFFRGDEGSWLFLIERGRVEISLMSVRGKKATLNHQGPGELIGELSALDRLPRSADATALSDTEGIVIPKQQLATVLQDDSAACLEFIRLLCSRVRNASDLFEQRAVASARERLAHGLIILLEKWGEPDEQGDWRLSQRLSQAALGEFAGLARENVNRLLKDWQADGWITFRQGDLTVHDVQVLREILDQAE